MSNSVNVAGLNIPQKLYNVLISPTSEGTDEHTKLGHTIEKYVSLFKTERPSFFPEYTDHAINHIEDILKTTSELINDDYLSELTPQSMTTYILAVVLHDLGMYCYTPMLKSLLSGDYDDSKIDKLDTETWAELWEKFIYEVQRYSDSKNKDLFGVEFPNINFVDIAKDAIKDSYHDHERLLIGEFLRRHHPRLAHEIAINGIVDEQNKKHTFVENFDTDTVWLAGFIARSHGMSLGTCIRFLENRSQAADRYAPFGIQIPELMILLRLSDYLQIQQGRTGLLSVMLRKFMSFRSKLEHDKHLSIKPKGIRYLKESKIIRVDTDAKNIIQFQELKRLFDSIQKEFNDSNHELMMLKKSKELLNYNQIAPDLEEKDNYDFVTEIITLKADDRISKLLVVPLYGEGFINYTYGIRELIQNSVDACLALKAIKGEQYIPTIKLDFFSKDGKYYFRIEDNGIGMTIDTLKNNFLTTGASFKKSKEYQNDLSSDDKNPLFTRTGRFGIGCLSTFLVGSSAEVITQHYTFESQYTFNFELDKSEFNISRKKSKEFGTKITIPITFEVYQNAYTSLLCNSLFDRVPDAGITFLRDIKKLIFEQRQGAVPNSMEGSNWYRWYWQDSPLVEYCFENIKIIDSKEFADSLQLDKWLDIPGNSPFESLKIKWTFSQFYQFINGFKMEKYALPVERNDQLNRSHVAVSMWINDKYENIEFTLSKNEISYIKDKSIFRKIEKEMCKLFLAHLLTV